MFGLNLNLPATFLKTRLLNADRVSLLISFEGSPSKRFENIQSFSKSLHGRIVNLLF